MELGRKAQRKSVRYADYLTHLARSGDCPRCIEPLEQDSRISAPAWQAWPYNATTGVRGVSLHHEAVVNATVR